MYIVIRNLLQFERKMKCQKESSRATETEEQMTAAIYAGDTK